MADQPLSGSVGRSQGGVDRPVNGGRIVAWIKVGQRLMPVCIVARQIRVEDVLMPASGNNESIESLPSDRVVVDATNAAVVQQQSSAVGLGDVWSAGAYVQAQVNQSPIL